MNCHNKDHPDCCHLVKHSGYWRCKIHGNMLTITKPEVQGCHYYEAPGEYAFRIALQKVRDDFDQNIKEFDEWRGSCIRRGCYAAIVILVLFTLFIWWIL